jgi:anti-sigma regulatory factor (Ser/Thr protein kinase)
MFGDGRNYSWILPPRQAARTPAARRFASARRGYSGLSMMDTATFRLAAGPDAAGTARRVLAETVRGQVDDGCLGTLRLLVSEVVTNSVRHSGTREALELSLRVNREVLVSVTDRGRGFTPGPRTGELDEVGGWGLQLVEQLSSHWGVACNGSTRVWFIVPAAERTAA